MSEEFFTDPAGTPAPRQGGRPSWLWPVIIVAIVAILIPVILLSRAPAQSDEITLSTLNDKLVAIMAEQQSQQDRLISLDSEMGGLAGTVGAIETHLSELEDGLALLDDIVVALNNLSDDVESINTFLAGNVTEEFAELSVAVTGIQGSLDEVKVMLAACNCTAPEDPEV